MKIIYNLRVSVLEPVFMTDDHDGTDGGDEHDQDLRHVQGPSVVRYVI